jgi:hypothetical protein
LSLPSRAASLAGTEFLSPCSFRAHRSVRTEHRLARSLCYINAVASSLQVHSEPPKMALTEHVSTTPRLLHSIIPSLHHSPYLSRFHAKNEIFGLAAGLLVGELAWRTFHEITGSACQSSAYSAIQG